MAQAVGVLVEVLQRRGLGADIAPAQRIALVALDPDDPLSLEVHGDAAAGLAQRAGAMDDAFDASGCPSPRMRWRGRRQPCRGARLR